jgi:hypothetical protein
MKHTITRWYSVLLLRDALGRFVKLRTAQSARPTKRRPRRPRIQIAAVQLVLF